MPDFGSKLVPGRDLREASAPPGPPAGTGPATILLLALLATLPGCSPPPPPPTRDASAGPNLLLVTIDTLRADRLGSYGHEAAGTPTLDRLAAEGVRFTDVVSPVPVTLPAHSSLMTGRHPHRHGVRDNGSFHLSPGAEETLAEVLGAAGRETGAFVGAFVLDRSFGIGQGFDAYTDFASAAAGLGGAPVSEVERPADAVVDEALTWIPARRTPFFAWVHLYDPHTPYEPPEPWRSQHPGSPYDGEVAYVDSAVRRLLDGLEDAGHGSDTLVAITADHGEGLGDHGEERHSFFVYESTLRVPLILWAADDLPAGVEVAGAASLVDLMPTILGLLGVADPAAESRDGVDLGPHIAEPERPGHAVYAESLIPRLKFGWSDLRALRADGYKYIRAPRPELYDLRSDPGETENLADSEPELAREMAARLEALIADDDPGSLLPGRQSGDAEALERLRGLGYLGAASPMPDRSDVDPKDRLDEFQAFTRASEVVALAAGAGDWERMDRELAVLEEIAPDHYWVVFSLGRLALRQGRADDAVALLEYALELNPSYVLTWVELASAYEASGRAADARRLLDEGVAQFPDSAALRVRQAYALLEAGEHAGARDTLARAVELSPDMAAAWNLLGIALFELDRPEEADGALLRALELRPDEPRFLNNRARILLRLDRRQDAIAALERALRIAPGYEPARRQLEQIGAARDRSSRDRPRA